MQIQIVEFEQNRFGYAVDYAEACFPAEAKLPGTEEDGDVPKVSFFFVGDDVFARRTWIMKPFSFRIPHVPHRRYNYSVPRFCSNGVTENVFGILAMRFMYFRRPK